MQRRSGCGNPARSLVFTMLLVAVLTAFISVNGAVAAWLPVVDVMATRLRWSPSRMLLPLGLRGACRVTACVDRHSGEHHHVRRCGRSEGGRFGYFDFTLVGMPLLAGTAAPE